MHKKQVIFLNSIFPVLSETFLFSQYTKMMDAGLEMKLVSSHKPTKDQIHPGMEPIQKQVDYLCDATVMQIILAHLMCLLRYPLGYLKALWASFFVEEAFLTTLKHISGAALVLHRYVGKGDQIWVHAHCFLLCLAHRPRPALPSGRWASQRCASEGIQMQSRPVPSRLVARLVF